MSLPIYVSLHCNFIMMESVLRSVWKRERATSPPGTSPGSAMILQRAKGSEDVHSDHWEAPGAINGRVRLERE